MVVTLAFSGAVCAQDQTTTFSPVTNWAGSYGISLQTYDMGSADMPTLQSFASGQYNGQWVMLAGRTNGLHSFTQSGTANFPPAYQNTSVWVIDPVTKQTWTKSLSDVSSGLSAAVINSLSATNTQSYQDGGTLFVSGGYVYDYNANNFTTYNALTAIDLGDVVSWVKGTSSNLAANSVLQTSGSSGFFAVTGGEMIKTGGTTHLVFGQKFEGPYTPGSNGVYTSQVRSFTVDYDKNAGTLSYTQTSVSPDPGDPTEFRRRDLNVAPSLMKDMLTGDAVEGITAYAGVFYNGSGVWTVPVEIDADGTPTQADPSAPGTFKQAMNAYASAKLGLYSRTTGEFTEYFFGGITANTYDPETGQLAYDDEYPFTSQITAVTRGQLGNYNQFYIGEYPTLTDGDGDTLLFGAEAVFFAAEGLPTFANGVIDLDALTANTLLGYIFGGIAADAPNFGNTAASNNVFAVYYTVPEPSTWALIGLAAVFVAARWIKSRRITA